MIDIVQRLKFDATRCEVQFSKGVAANISEGAAEIERLRARATRAHDALRAMFWEGGIDQDDARKVQGILRGDDEQPSPPEGDNDPNGNRDLAREIDGA